MTQLSSRRVVFIRSILPEKGKGQKKCISSSCAWDIRDFLFVSCITSSACTGIHTPDFLSHLLQSFIATIPPHTPPNHLPSNHPQSQQPRTPDTNHPAKLIRPCTAASHYTVHVPLFDFLRLEWEPIDRHPRHQQSRSPRRPGEYFPTTRDLAERMGEEWGH